MYYRIILVLLCFFALIAYVDTKSLKQHFDEIKLSHEYKNAEKIIGIGLKDKDGKLKVKEILSNTPADASGVEVGDILLYVDGKQIDSAEMLKNHLQCVKKDEKIALKIQKPDNRIVEVELKPITINNFEQIYTK